MEQHSFDDTQSLDSILSWEVRRKPATSTSRGADTAAWKWLYMVYSPNSPRTLTHARRIPKTWDKCNFAQCKTCQEMKTHKWSSFTQKVDLVSIKWQTHVFPLHNFRCDAGFWKRWLRNRRSFWRCTYFSWFLQSALSQYDNIYATLTRLAKIAEQCLFWLQRHCSHPRHPTVTMTWFPS